jgi:hypothetical protein
MNISFANPSKTSGLDSILSTTISDLTDRKRRTATPSFEQGTRVVAHTNNGIILPSQLPSSGTKGTVVAVDTPDGEITSLEGEIFVRFDNRNKIDRIPSDFLKVASMKVANLDEHFIVLSGPSLMCFASEQPALIHKSSEDLWTVKMGEDGSYEVERLFDDKGNPLKL